MIAKIAVSAAAFAIDKAQANHYNYFSRLCLNSI